MFRSLMSVGGALRVLDVDLIAAPYKAFDALTMAGSLDWDSGGDMSQIGSSAITVGGLRVNDNAWLTDLTPVFSKYAIAPSATIAITNNPNLPECAAAAWAAGLPGHLGPVTISGNQACP